MFALLLRNWKGGTLFISVLSKVWLKSLVVFLLPLGDLWEGYPNILRKCEMFALSVSYCNIACFVGSSASHYPVMI